MKKILPDSGDKKIIRICALQSFKSNTHLRVFVGVHVWDWATHRHIPGTGTMRNTCHARARARAYARTQSSPLPRNGSGAGNRELQKVALHYLCCKGLLDAATFCLGVSILWDAVILSEYEPALACMRACERAPHPQMNSHTKSPACSQTDPRHQDKRVFMPRFFCTRKRRTQTDQDKDTHGKRDPNERSSLHAAH